MIGLQVQSLGACTTRPVRVSLCPGALAGGDDISAGMLARHVYAYEVCCCQIYCCPNVVDDGVLAIEGA